MGKELAAKPENPSSVPTTHTVGEGDWLLLSDLYGCDTTDIKKLQYLFSFLPSLTGSLHIALAILELAL